MPPTVLEFDSVDDLRERWLRAPDLPFRPILITGDPARLLVRVAPQELPAAKNFFTSHQVTVGSHPVVIRLAIQTQPDPDASVAHLRARFVGAPVDEARDELTTLGWMVRIGTRGGAATADHLPRRLNLIISDQSVVIDLFTG